MGDEVTVEGFSLFAHGTGAMLVRTAALVNTYADVERLTDVSALDHFIRVWGWPDGPRRHDEAELLEIRDLRSHLQIAWHGSEARTVDLINNLFRSGNAQVKLVRCGRAHRLSAFSPSACLAGRAAVSAAIALAELARTNELQRLGLCTDPHCHNVLVDFSRNNSKRFCGTNCGTRNAVAAYRARRSKTLGGQGFVGSSIASPPA